MKCPHMFVALSNGGFCLHCRYQDPESVLSGPEEPDSAEFAAARAYAIRIGAISR